MFSEKFTLEIAFTKKRAISTKQPALKQLGAFVRRPLQWKHVAYLICLLAFCQSSALQAAKDTKWDTEYWQFLRWKNWENGPYKFYASGEFRVNKDVTQFYFYRVTANFAYEVNKNLTLEAHNSWEWEKPLGSTHFMNADRVELEINPSVKLDHDILVRWRNRFEFIKRQGNSRLQYIFRHLVRATLPVKNCGKLAAINAFNEVFYDFRTGRVIQNRFAPIELSFQLKKELSVDLFLLIRNVYAARERVWHNSLVLGSVVGF